MKIQKALLKKLSFPDFIVQKMTFFELKKRIEIYLNGAYLDINDGKLFASGNLFFYDYQKIEAKLYDNDKWIDLNPQNYDSLKSIEEFIYINDNVYIKGFGKKTGKWIEYKIVSPKIEANFI
ncbi:MAG: hypothetical protein K940chlam4_01178 [Candidatus Anoxychlamydiales bacterium]|nr:hypothetical protein [Candidatus Anoxychlamydiales bacterium]